MYSKRLPRRFIAIVAFALALPTFASDGIDPQSKGQTVYVPIYSQIWHGNTGQSGKAVSENMSVLVSIRNTDPKSPIRVLAAPYYNTAGALIGDYLPAPRTIGPFATLELFVERRESEGGSGANFAVHWDATAPVSPPIVEALHSLVQAGRTMSFISRGKPISSP